MALKRPNCEGSKKPRDIRKSDKANPIACKTVCVEWLMGYPLVQISNGVCSPWLKFAYFDDKRM